MAVNHKKISRIRTGGQTGVDRAFRSQDDIHIGICSKRIVVD